MASRVYTFPHWYLLKSKNICSAIAVARLTAQVSPVSQQAQAGAKEVVDYAFWQAILAIGIALLSALIYRFLGPRLTPATRSKTNSP